MTTTKGFRARWRDPSGRQCQRTFPTAKEKKDHEAKMRVAMSDRTYVDDRDATTVAQFARDYAELKRKRRDHRATTSARLVSVIENHLASTRMGEMRLVDVDRPDWDRWEADLFDRVTSPAFARKVIGDMRSVFAQAVEYRKIARSPAPRRVSKSAPKPTRRDKTFSRDGVERLVAAMAEVRPDAKSMVVVQAGLGLRLGELVSLRVSDVNKREGTVRVGSQITGEVKERTDELKTERSRATIHAPRYVIDAITEHLATYPTGIDGSIFTNRGVAWQQNAYRRVFNRALEVAGLDAAWRPHDLRHYCGTMMVAEGYTLPQVARFLRDKLETVIAVYAHPVDDEEEVAAGMDAAWRREA